MSYITTFDAAFFAGIALFLIGEVLSRVFIKQVVLFTMKKPILSGVVYMAVWIAEIIIWFSWSPEGTTTLTFWSLVAFAIFHKQIFRYVKRSMETNAVIAGTTATE